MFFPQADQIINSDSYSSGSIRLIVLGSLFSVLALWLSFGSLSFYELSSMATLSADNLVLATFPSEQLDEINVEQVAEVLYVNSADEQLTAPALILRKTTDSAESTAQIDLLVTERDAFIDLFGEDGDIKQVRVLRETISPLHFILAAAGLIE